MTEQEQNQNTKQNLTPQERISEAIRITNEMKQNLRVELRVVPITKNDGNSVLVSYELKFVAV